MAPNSDFPVGVDGPAEALVVFLCGKASPNDSPRITALGKMLQTVSRQLQRSTIQDASTLLAALEARIAPLRERLAQHPLYASITTLAALRRFMESHVFAVWDFMSLLKSLQRTFTCVDVPWVPTMHAEARHLVNEIVLGEESDVYQGRSLSHFEVYVEAMRQCGASSAAMDALIARLRDKMDIQSALTDVPEPSRAFLKSTFAILAQNRPHATAAAFTFGREDLIPEMFHGFVRDLNRTLAGQVDIFQWYLERHIEVDGEEHGPMSRRMVIAICGDDRTKWAEAGDAAETALQARLALWNALAAESA